LNESVGCALVGRRRCIARLSHVLTGMPADAKTTAPAYDLTGRGAGAALGRAGQNTAAQHRRSRRRGRQTRTGAARDDGRRPDTRLGHGTATVSIRNLEERHEGSRPAPWHEPTTMATRQEMSDFLASAERRAFKHALYAVRDEEAALDLVQDAMMRLAEKYSDKPPAELPLLFQRILQNAVTDHFRRQKVRSVWTTLLSSLFAEDEDGSARDPLDSIEPEVGTTAAESASDQVERSQVMAIIETEIGRLPPRQREAFLMRYWEDMDVAETAAAMGCSQGSVKTHCSRATHTLALALKARGITL